MAKTSPEEKLVASIFSDLRQLAGMPLPTKGATRTRMLNAFGAVVQSTHDIRRALEAGDKPERAVLERINRDSAELATLAPGLSSNGGRAVRGAVRALITQLEDLDRGLDPIRLPTSVFDPGDPETAGRLVALALLAQQRLPLDMVGNMYGSGVYAIYYKGSHPAYAAVTGTETPLYVGKADPVQGARSPQEQGTRLSKRLLDHRRMIKTAQRYAEAPENNVEHAIRIEDFEYRRLVVATHAQLVAEQHLIAMFQPIWNSEIGVCWGISKHGDSPDMRGHDRSPWDVLHPGRRWAMSPKLGDSKSRATIFADIVRHYEAIPPVRDTSVIVTRFLNAFSQEPVEVGAPNDPVDVLGEPIDDEEARV